MKITITILVVIMATTLNSNSLFAVEKKGFKIEKPLIPAEEMRNGGPPRDGIPSIDRPKFVEYKNSELKTGKAMYVEYNGVKKLYPIQILDLHEIVNDQFEGQPVAVTYCPLCGSGLVFNSQVGFKKLTFGVSGLLYQSDVLLYDRETESLWSQLMRKSVNGPLKGKVLEVIPSKLVDLEDYKKESDVLVLSTKTGYNRDYKTTAYEDYKNNERLMFPVLHQDKGTPNKTWSLLVESKGERMIVPLTSLSGEKGTQEISVKGQKIKVEYDKKRDLISCHEKESVTCFFGYYFALRTFYPEAASHEKTH